MLIFSHSTKNFSIFSIYVVLLMQRNLTFLVKTKEYIMRTLKYAILGLLNQQDMTGYELMKQFESTLCEFWSAKHSQIYPELKKLTDEGQIEYKIEITGTVLEKKLYSITEAGKKDFMTWLGKDVQMEPTPKNIFRLKMFFSGTLDPEIRAHLLESQLTQHEKRLEHLQRNQQKFDCIPDTNSNEFGDYLVLMGAIMREEMNCEWLRTCIQLCQS